VPAASLILVRRQAAELQVYLLRRSRDSGFMAGNFVFPGGLVDRGDRDASGWLAHADLPASGVEQRFGAGLEPQEAVVFAVAAIRETFEEAGALMADPPAGADAAAGLSALLARRESGQLGRGWLQSLVFAEGWRLKFSALWRWSHWVTPELMPRRFDTRFFLAEVPQGQICRPDNHEVTLGVWMSPRRALEENLAGRTALSPPTVVTLNELLRWEDARDLRPALGDRGWGAAIMPRLVPLAQGYGAVIVEPWDPCYGQERIEIEPSGLPDRLLPAGAPFSRLWNGDGIWRPVKAV
jgi:8-oxo-dGTP pyrophosphatase MutT (NUDIX family)